MDVDRIDRCRACCHHLLLPEAGLSAPVTDWTASGLSAAFRPLIRHQRLPGRVRVRCHRGMASLRLFLFGAAHSGNEYPSSIARYAAQSDSCAGGAWPFGVLELRLLLSKSHWKAWLADNPV